MKKYQSFLFLILLLTGCSRSPSEVVARQFMDLYYVRADLLAALESTDGVAREKLKKGIELTEGRAMTEAAHHPKIRVTLLESHQEKDESDYLFQVIQYSLVPKAKGSEEVKCSMLVSRMLITAEKV